MAFKTYTFATTHGDVFCRSKKGNDIHIVCVHGAGGDSRLFLPLMQNIKTASVHAIDLPAHGNTTIRNCSLETYTDVVEQFIRSLQGKIVLVGHSMGGGILFEVSQRNVSIHAAIFIATAAELPVNPVVFQLIDSEFESFCHWAVELSYSGNDESLRRATVEYLKRTGPEVLKNDFTLCASFNYNEYAKKYPFPACFITSRKDKLVPVDIVYATFKLIPRAMLYVLPFVGHMVHVEQSVYVAQCIENFISML